MPPLISIVSGTFQRIDYLRRMVASVRRNIPVGISYELVLIDGGSTDGTIEWAKAQDDIRLIEHGALLGAIYAFTEGAKSARGKYVLMSNDDIEFLDDSIMPAVAYLEDNANCGAVAFPDNRKAGGKTGGEFGCQYTPAFNGRGSTTVIYAQVGLFRKWLGDACNWWGYGELNSRTYGGDNFLSARIWELGYTVDCVAQCRIVDHVPKDKLRADNAAANDRGYHALYPAGAHIASKPKPANPDRPQLRVLYLPIYEPGHDVQLIQKRGLREALARRFITWEYDYLSAFVSPSEDIPRICRVFKPHLVVTQIHDAKYVSIWQAIREHAPNAIVANWNGDVWPHSLVSDDMLHALQWVDLQTTVNANTLDEYAAADIPAAYWQAAFEPVNEADIPNMPPHDIVFLGNAYTPERIKLGKFLRGLPYNVGIYGRGWDDQGVTSDGECLYDFAKTRSIYRKAKLTIGDNQYPEYRGFVSNRIFDAMAAGNVLMLHQKIAGLEEYMNYIPRKHLFEWVAYDDLEVLILNLLSDDATQDRQNIAAAGMEFTHLHHSFDARVTELMTLIKAHAVRRDNVPV